MWWLVTIRPSGETNPPEPPLLNRTDAFWACSSQASVRSKPYFLLRSCRGGSLSSHIPSSACTRGTAVNTSTTRTRGIKKDERYLTLAEPFWREEGRGKSPHPRKGKARERSPARYTGGWCPHPGPVPVGT